MGCTQARAAPVPVGGLDWPLRDRLRDRKIFVLDNSLRESTVGQAVGHSFEDKCHIYECLRDVGFTHIVVAALAEKPRVDDAFCEWLRDGAAGGAPKPPPHLRRYSIARDKAKPARAETYTFSEFYAGARGRADATHLPVALTKAEAYGVRNAILEVDLADDAAGPQWPVADLVAQCGFLASWCFDHLAGGRVFVNVRDLPLAMVKAPARVVAFVDGLGALDARPRGILYEEPLGSALPSEFGAWTATLRRAMDARGWTSAFQEAGVAEGLLLAHYHQQWGLGYACVNAAIAAGADGIWCSAAEEGAAQGHACSAVTLLGLARLGNDDVAARYDLPALGKAAKVVTHATTRRAPYPRQVVYGPRAVEAVFGFAGIAGEVVDGDHAPTDLAALDAARVGRRAPPARRLAELLHVDEAVRLNALSSNELWKRALDGHYGHDGAYTDDRVEAMKAYVEANLAAKDERFEYTSVVGLAMLYERVHGAMPRGMREAVDAYGASAGGREAHLLAEAKRAFLAASGGAPVLDHRAFLDVYVNDRARHLGLPATALDELMHVFDLDGDDEIEWTEWAFWLLWTIRNFPDECVTAEDVHAATVRHAVTTLKLDKALRDVCLWESHTHAAALKIQRRFRANRARAPRR